MTKVICDMAISADGFAAGPNQRLDEPFGDGIDGRLTRWMIEEREAHKEIIDGIVAAGAHVMGRKMFSSGSGPWADDPKQPWTELTFDQFGFHATLAVKTIQALYYKAGRDRLLTIVLVRDLAGAGVRVTAAAVGQEQRADVGLRGLVEDRLAHGEDRVLLLLAPHDVHRDRALRVHGVDQEPVRGPDRILVAEVEHDQAVVDG